MKRRTILMTAASMMLLASCSQPAGVDGNLVDDWPAHAEAAFVLPVVGACDPDASGDPVALSTSIPPRPFDCAEAHELETYFVGTFTGLAAQLPEPPGLEDARDAYAQCGEEATKFLGGDWRLSRLRIMLMIPPARQWRGGARYFRCDLVEIDVELWIMVSRSGSARGGLTGDRPLAESCAQRKEIGKLTWEIANMVPCSEPHNHEFVGYFQVSERPYPQSDEARRVTFEDGCGSVAAAYLGMSVAQLIRHRQLNWGWWVPDEWRWRIGDRAARCYVLVIDGRTVNRSLKGTGNTRL